MKQIFLKSIIAGIGFFGTLFLGLVVYAAWTNILTKTDGTTINASIWNELVNNMNTIGNKVETLVPSGAVMSFNLSSCPTGWVLADGSNGTPDLRGEFIRGLDSGRGVDTGRTLASNQLDAFQGHRHRSTVDANIGAGFLGSGGRYADGTSLNWQNNFEPVSDGVNGTPRVASETRPRNVALLYCVKL